MGCAAAIASFTEPSRMYPKIAATIGAAIPTPTRTRWTGLPSRLA
jgi:hypothetical protein